MVRAGLYGPPGGKRRQRWWCRPKDGSPAHRFAERLPRTLLGAGDAHACAECETRLADHEGPQHARQYEFAARVIAQALVAVGSGVSYVHAARTARVAAGVGKTWRASSRTHPGRVGANGTLVADWVGSMTPVVAAPVFEGESWPSVVAFDELPFGTSLKMEGRRSKTKPMWVIFGAYAHPERGRRGHLFRLGASGDLGAVAAAAWLRSVPGRPEHVVADGSKMWPKAIALAWPPVADPVTGEIVAETPTFWDCRWHLHRQLREALRSESVLPPRDAPAKYRNKPTHPPAAKGATLRREVRVRAQEPDFYQRYRVALRTYDDPEHHPLTVAVAHAFDSVESWDECLALARKWQANTLAQLMVRLERVNQVRADLETRPRQVPASIGGLEAELAQIRRMVRDRAQLLRNTRRTNLLLDLMTLHRRNLDQVDAYATRIREHLEAHQGTAPTQRIGVTGGAHMY